jgi:hypothetical protein
MVSFFDPDESKKTKCQHDPEYRLPQRFPDRDSRSFLAKKTQIKANRQQDNYAKYKIAYLRCVHPFYLMEQR